MNPLTSRNNPKVKLIRLLRQRKTRQETGLFLVEGIRHVGEAVAAHAPVEILCYVPDLLDSDFACQLVEQQRAVGVTCLAVDAETFSSLSDKENPQSLLAVVRKRTQAVWDLDPVNFPWGVALVAPQDPGNIGTILRTIDAVGASGLLLLDNSADPYHPAAVRASMGAIFWHPVIQATFAEFISWVDRHAYHLYGTSAHGDLDYLQIDCYEQPMVLLLGSEREGLSAGQAAHCQYLIRMPMRGRATSLNLGVAAGVMLYSILERIDRK